MTICPITKLPELIFVEVDFEKFAEIFEVRKKIKKSVTRKRVRFMEAVADDLLNDIPEAAAVKVKLLFGKHIVSVKR